MTPAFPQLSDDDRLSRALAAVIVNDTTLLSECSHDRELTAREVTVRRALHQDVARSFRDWASLAASVLRRLAGSITVRQRAADTTQL